MAPKLILVVAMCKLNRGIGINGSLPWRIKSDMEFFRKVTLKTRTPDSRNVVIMGRKTWDSIPNKMKPLKGRLNIVLSHSLQLATSSDVHVSKSFEEALNFLSTTKDIENVFVIGGSSIYKMALRHNSCYRIYLTDVLKEFHCDTFFPHFDNKVFRPIRLPDVDFSLKQENDIPYKFTCFQKLKSLNPKQDLGHFSAVPVYIVAAMEENRGIGFNGKLPWPTIRKDLDHYLSLVRGTEDKPSVAICGRKTWESMTTKERNLPNVLYVVISNSIDLENSPEACSVVQSFDEALSVTLNLLEDQFAAKVCFLGGQYVYQEAIDRGICNRMFLTRILNKFSSDVFFPVFEHHFLLDENSVEGEDRNVEVEENGVKFVFEEYKPIQI